MSDTTPKYNQIYDEKSFRKGFQLIDHQSDEKLTIAIELTEILSNLLKKKKPITALDIAGGSGNVWKHVQQLIPTLSPENISVTLIDSSEEQVKHAQGIAHSLPWLHPQQSGIEYFHSFSQQFDLISAIHFLPGLPAEVQQEVIISAQKNLTSGGIFLVVQPNKANPLTQAKVALRKRLKDEVYVPKYILNENITEGWKSKTIKSTLTVTEEQLIDLGNFLAETQFTPGDKYEKERAIIKEELFEISEKVGDMYTIALSNDYLLWIKQ